MIFPTFFSRLTAAPGGGRGPTVYHLPQPAAVEPPPAFTRSAGSACSVPPDLSRELTCPGLWPSVPWPASTWSCWTARLGLTSRNGRPTAPASVQSCPFSQLPGQTARRQAVYVNPSDYLVEFSPGLDF